MWSPNSFCDVCPKSSENPSASPSSMAATGRPQSVSRNSESTSKVQFERQARDRQRLFVAARRRALISPSLQYVTTAHAKRGPSTGTLTTHSRRPSAADELRLGSRAANLSTRSRPGRFRRTSRSQTRGDPFLSSSQDDQPERGCSCWHKGPGTIWHEMSVR